MDLALNNLQWLMCHKTKPKQTKNLSEGIPMAQWLTYWTAISS